MNRITATLVAGAALLATAASACERSPRDLTAEELASIKAEVKAELMKELEGELRPAGRPGQAPPVTLSAAERAAIAEARAKALPGDPPPVVAPRVAALPPSAPAAPNSRPVADTTEPDDPELPPPVDVVAPADATDHESGPAREVRPGMIVYPGTGELELVDLAIATAIAQRQPQDVRTVYDRMPELFFCYTVFSNPTAEQMVTHVWRHGGRLVSRVELEVGKSPKWRTWSRQRTRQDWTGAWSCEVLDPNGRRIGMASFDVGG